jgi:hypothetical protein
MVNGSASDSSEAGFYWVGFPGFGFYFELLLPQPNQLSIP